ncbi:MAG TPA: protein kinase, partial [Nannocystaceae bacterium]|nr:protein kinase [Nannocystaceae bacterium]
MTTLAFLPLPHTVTSEAEDVGTETRWRVQLADGTRCVVGQLVADLARDVSIRRRYVRDIERVKALEVYSLAPTIALGPAPDPRDPGADPPWRVRIEPEGEPLQRWLDRAPLPIEEVSQLFAAVADAVYAVHMTGAVLRDLRPEQIIRVAGGRFVLTDVGLARVDVLSSHTASSLLLRGSTYVAPEQLVKTAVDQRSDLWSLGVMMWQALTGSLPFGDGPPLLADHHTLPALATVRHDVPVALDELVRRCLEVDIGKRPGSAAEIAWVLRGGFGLWEADDTTVCQHCHSRLRVGQRLCLACGRLAVRFEHSNSANGWALELVSLSEQAEPLRWLQSFIQDVSSPPVSKPEFLIGSVHMYSDEEKIGRIRLPARLYG